LRIGVGSEFSKGQQVDYVLGDFEGEEKKGLETLLEKCSETLMCVASHGLAQAMNKFNQ
jgi:PTH1 family peptidyl-tRNA hydrolase